MLKRFVLLVSFGVLIGLSGCHSESVNTGDNSPVKLQVEYRNEPLGIDVLAPRFSWQMPTQVGVRGQSQQAYQIIVSDEQHRRVWDSGRIEDSRSLHVTYQGAPLEPTTRYDWSVNVWDQSGAEYASSSWFETGLLNTKLSAWEGAEWIGVNPDDIAFNAFYLPLHDLEVSLQILPGSQRAGIVLAANDPRFTDPYKNVYQVKNQPGESYFKVELDVTEIASDGLARLHFYRAGYTPDDDPNTPIASFNIHAAAINKENAHELHNLLIHNEYGVLTVQIDGRGDIFDPARELSGFERMMPPLVMGAKVQLNPLGHNHDYITYGMLGEIGFAVPAEQQAVFKDLVVRNIHQPRNVLFSETAVDKLSSLFVDASDQVQVSAGEYLVNGGSTGLIVTADPSKNSAPLLRSEFSVAAKPIAKARLYSTARGVYEMYLNGERVGDSFFNPGLTQYNKTHQYQTYDVTNLLNQGANALGAMVSEGWWSGQLSYGNTWHAFGDRQALLSKLVVTYHDGSRDVFVSSPDTWKYSVAGPIRYSSLNMGEIYDARLEAAVSGWDKSAFDDGQWRSAVVVGLDETQSLGVRPNMSFTAQSWDFSEQALVGQIDEPARIFKTLQAQTVAEVRPGVFVYDLGQNIVGVPKVHFTQGNIGETVTLRFAEMLYPDLPESGPNVGMIVTENYRAALSQDIYIMRQGEQTYQPYFTSHGFRYIEISGIEQALPLESVQGLAMSSIQKLNADFTTSNPKVNKLWQNLTWSAIDNFLSVPTDCPQRNERMGWSGDINVFSRTATYLTDAAPFLSRHLLGMRDIQPDNGRFTDIAPLGGGFGGVLWGSAGITVAWENYQQYGDVATLREHYPAMVRYMDYLDSVIDPENGILMDAQLGDWLGPQNGQLGSIYLASAYHVFTLKIMQNVATVLDRPNDAQKYAEQHQQRRDYFNSTFIKDGQPQGIVGSGPMFNAMVPPFKTQTAATQTAYAVPLALDVFADEQRSIMAKGLLKVVSQSNVDDGGIERPPYSLMTGFIGTAWISKALSDAGYDDDAYRLLTNETYPSWLYSVNQGATTIWERLNGFTVENGFGGNNSMNSFNHYSFGAVGQWMMANAAGIQRAEPGFHHFVLQPSIDRSGSIEWVKGHYDSPYGRIESAWKLVDGVLNYQATVPANTTAQLVLPRGTDVKEGGKSLVEGNGISDIMVRDGKLILRLGSGTYDFTASGI